MLRPTRATVDQAAFYPFRRLVEGPLTDPRDLAPIERFLRAVVLHDEMFMDLEPVPGPDNELLWNEEDKLRGVRAAIVSFGPDLDGYEPLIERWPRSNPQIEGPPLSTRLIGLAADFSNAGPGDVYYQAHLDYLSRLGLVLRTGGSVVCEGEFGKAAFERPTEFPSTLFEGLDKEWESYAREAYEGFGLTLPPVLSIVLTRAARRDAIATIVGDLRAEWGDARRRIWESIHTLKTAETLAEAHEIRRELAEAAKRFSPAQEQGTLQQSPLRVIWDIFATAAVGALSGNPAIGVLGGTTKALIENAPHLARDLFGGGAFDLARRVRTELREVESTTPLLSRLLTPSELEELSRGVADAREDFDSWIRRAPISDLDALCRSLVGRTFMGRIEHAPAKKGKTQS